MLNSVPGSAGPKDVFWFISNVSGSAAWLPILLIMDVSFEVEKPHCADGIDEGITIGWIRYCWDQNLFMISAHRVLAYVQTKQRGPVHSAKGLKAACVQVSTRKISPIALARGRCSMITNYLKPTSRHK